MFLMFTICLTTDEGMKGKIYERDAKNPSKTVNLMEEAESIFLFYTTQSDRQEKRWWLSGAEEGNEYQSLTQRRLVQLTRRQCSLIGDVV